MQALMVWLVGFSNLTLLNWPTHSMLYYQRRGFVAMGYSLSYFNSERFNPSAAWRFKPISVTSIFPRLVQKFITQTFLRPAIPSSVIADQLAFKPTGSTTDAFAYFIHYVGLSF
jgi:hypothetical protein